MKKLLKGSPANLNVVKILPCSLTLCSMKMTAFAEHRVLLASFWKLS